jgi:polynucleotide 5'-hydroxyl-kinase GRC3/NOL9
VDKYEALIERIVSEPGTVLILGGIDSGKTTFAHRLLEASVAAGTGAALLDTDGGQGTVGPPTTIGLKLIGSLDDLEPANLARADGLYFVGWISPQGHLLPWVAGTYKLMNRAIEAGPGLRVVDTTGLIAGVYGQVLKFHKLESVRPDYVVGFQRGEELEPLLGIARRFTPAHVESLPVHPAVVPVSAEDRAGRRRERLSACFAEPLHRWRAKPTVFMPSVPPGSELVALDGLIVGMEDGKGNCVGLGLLEYHEEEQVLRILSSVSEGVRALRLGSTRVGPGWATSRVDLRQLFGTE